MSPLIAAKQRQTGANRATLQWRYVQSFSFSKFVLENVHHKKLIIKRATNISEISFITFIILPVFTVEKVIFILSTGFMTYLTDSDSDSKPARTNKRLN